jgi:Ca2+-binding EF-hand superfamily protein
MGKFSKINPQIKSKLQQISDYMIRNNITLDSMHKQLDVNNDGSIDKLEFVTGLSNIMTTSLLTRQDLGTIFDVIDINGDNYLSVNEFGYFLQGVKLKKEEKKAKLD